MSSKPNNTEHCTDQYRDSEIAILKVRLPSKEEMMNGDVQFSNEEIRILEQPDFSNHLENAIETPSSAAALSHTPTITKTNRRAAIGDKVWTD